MAEVLFFEKPGCANNRRQRELLEASGHVLTVRDLLSTAWHRDELLSFMEMYPVENWFNRASPRVKSGEIDPASLDTETALALLISDPLLIRRPLIQVGDWRAVGFDPEQLTFLLGEHSENLEKLSPMAPESCQRKDSCPTPQRKKDH